MKRCRKAIVRLGASALLFALVAPTALPVLAAGERLMSADQAKSSLRFVREMPTQSQKMSVHVLLIALGVDVEQQVKALTESREEFLKVLHALRNGNEEAGVPVIDDRDLTKALIEIEGSWPQFDQIVQAALKTKKVKGENVAALAALNGPLLAATEEAAEAFAKRIGVGNTGSILMPITDQAEQQTLRLQQMFKHSLLIVYGHQPSDNQAALAGHLAQFDRVLIGLRYGDPELKLLPAVTPQISAQLDRVIAPWGQAKSLYGRMANGGALEGEALEQFARQSDALYQEVEKVADMYEKL